MTLEQLVPTLDICQQLKAARFPQDTALRWSMQHEPHIPDVEPAWMPIAFNEPILCAAPTASELEEWLLCNGCDNILVKNESADGENAVGISCIHSDGRDFEAHEATEIEAKAALVLEVAG